MKNKKSLEDVLGEGLYALAQMYLSKAKAGDLTAAEQKAFIELLKNNDVTIEFKKGELLEELTLDSLGDEFAECYIGDGGGMDELIN